MTDEEFSKLTPGDMVSSVNDQAHTYIVTAVYGSRATAVRSADMTHAGEWVMIRKVGQTQVVYTGVPTYK